MRNEREERHLLLENSEFLKKKTEDSSTFTIKTISSLTFMFYLSFMMFQIFVMF